MKKKLKIKPKVKDKTLAIRIIKSGLTGLFKDVFFADFQVERTGKVHTLIGLKAERLLNLLIKYPAIYNIQQSLKNKEKENKMNTERLRTLMYALRADKLPIKSFDLRSWAGNNTDPFYEDQNLCGTSACACGLGTLIPEFKQAGFKLITVSNERARAIFGRVPMDFAELYFKNSNGTEFFGISAAKEFFDISELEVNKLFIAGNYSDDHNPLLVAERIEMLLDGKNILDEEGEEDNDEDDCDYDFDDDSNELDED